MKIILLLITTMLLSCTSKTIRSEDLISWQGISLIELETHPIFSSLARERRLLSNGQTLINYYDKKVISSPATCLNTGIGNFNQGSFYNVGTQFCGDRDMIEKRCVHQFLVEKEIVLSYKVLGDDCYTTCEHQPTSKKMCR